MGLTIHEIGQYSPASMRGTLDIYMVEHQGGIDGFLGHKEPPAVTYCMDISGNTELLFWPDWRAFATKVNSYAGESFLDPDDDPAVTESIAIATGMECPDCGNRIMDFLCPLDGAEDLPEEAADADILCDNCSCFYSLGEN